MSDQIPIPIYTRPPSIHAWVGTFKRSMDFLRHVFLIERCRHFESLTRARGSGGGKNLGNLSESTFSPKSINVCYRVQNPT
jgi:hypothetical protein